jgi:hypothetical protein
LDNRFQAIYSTQLEKNLAFCPICYANAATKYYVVCLGCGTTYWMRADKIFKTFTFAYQNECGWCLGEGYFTERILYQWEKVWQTKFMLRQSCSLSSFTGIGELSEVEDDT